MYENKCNNSVYNEENFIKTLKKINDINLNLQIIVVNDGSHDDTRKILIDNRYI